MASPSPKAERTYTIRQLCQEFDVTPRSLRFYEDKGLLFPARQGLNRIYSHRDRARLILILRGMLDLYDKDDSHAAQLVVTVKKFRERIVALEAQRVELDRAIEGLKLACARTEGMLDKIQPESDQAA